MRCDVTRCVTGISNEVKYLDKKESYKNSIPKELYLESEVLFEMQSE